MIKVEQDCFGNLHRCKVVCERYINCLEKNIEIDMKMEVRD
jgi:hypothetical protein